MQSTKHIINQAHKGGGKEARLKLFYERCVYVRLHICLSFCAHMTKPLTGESSPYTRN